MEWHDVAQRQRGLITRWQLHDLGFTDGQIHRLVAEHHWRQVQAGVYLTGSRPPDWEQRVLAAILAAGGDAHASHRTAARLRGFDGAERHTTIEITVSVLRGPAPAGVIVHRSRRDDPADRTEMNGIPVSTAERTLLDYAAKVPPILVERAVEDAIRRGRTTEGALRRRLERSGKGVRGVTKLRRVLDGRPEGRPARSGFEVIVLDILREHGLPLPVRRLLVDVGAGRKLEVDLAYPDDLVAIEAKGKRWHSTARQLAADAEREAILRSLGWTIVDVEWDEAIHEPAALAGRVASARTFLRQAQESTRKRGRERASSLEASR